ncbi:TIGR03943 family protein [Herbivorax sp. ANBcel31]|uniref:TIGR03943 family putative permease subunit n=1 Tax=Herbivorax sp. ANBcel31 TaxID=3069754 RepID=UPI0027AEC1F1|nr:TIGR03943 family protein [Herbivorax sp. ANBcel31]MDQ2087637.1 TIGR03943 family protein [Herbivorax sp. ANBcel31]
MRILKYYEINVDAILKSLILLGFAAFFLISVFNENYIFYVNPRYVTYIIYASIAKILISIFFLKDIFRPVRRQKPNKLNYLIFFIPLLMAFLIPGGTIETNSLHSFQMSTHAGAGSGDNEVEVNKEYSESTNSKQQNIMLQDGKIIMDDQSFMYWYDELYINQRRYIGKEIEVVGFVFRMDDFNESEFVPARFIMTCCAADMQPGGFLCRYENASQFEDAEWVKVIGTVEQITFRDQPMPVIVAHSVEHTEKPDNEYVYPF